MDTILYSGSNTRFIAYIQFFFNQVEKNPFLNQD